MNNNSTSEHITKHGYRYAVGTRLFGYHAEFAHATRDYFATSFKEAQDMAFDEPFDEVGSLKEIQAASGQPQALTAEDIEYFNSKQNR